MKTVNNKREANMDLMRSVAMFLIVLLHSFDHSGVLENLTEGTMLYYYSYLLFFVTKVCVNSFVLLSGYYLIKSTFKLKKLVILWLQVVFYSVALRILFVVIGIEQFSLGSLLSCFMPILSGRYWFITIYFGLYLLSPFINTFLLGLSKTKYFNLLSVLFVLFSVMISIHPIFKGMNSGAGWGITWFVVLYISAGYFRLFYEKNGKVLVSNILFWVIPVFVTVLLFVSQKLNIGILETIVMNWFRYDSVPVYVMSLLLMAVMIRVRINSDVIGRILSVVSPATFGVYLIHAHPDVSPWLWEMLNLPQYMDGVTFPLIQIGITAAIFFVCAVIDIIRNLIFGRFERGRFLDFVCVKVESIFLKVFEKIRPL